MKVINAECRTHVPSVASYRHLAGRVLDETLSLTSDIVDLLCKHCEEARRTRLTSHLSELLCYYEANQHLWSMGEYDSKGAWATVRGDLSVFVSDSIVCNSSAYQNLVRPYVGLAGSTFQYLRSCLTGKKTMLLDREAGQQPIRRGWDLSPEQINKILDVPGSAPRGVLERSAQIKSNLLKVAEYEAEITRLENAGVAVV